ncbi:MAG: hypothetical protein B193_1532 [Solidesulfovibrio magneticus str. Maddingley MBC34]|uniref:3-keto-disaccharide hydrolase domain-containing protein n=1 Tax=Solidesulfovibrio magneticus str. Maddingley MBC34 TaxID=1206767 RepID=K6GRZ0_9BACT|nr:MAG: hypothetical protein B193_1532 [Solidesulfovibrio magneticus str. Maddingley MBC34]
MDRCKIFITATCLVGMFLSPYNSAWCDTEPEQATLPKALMGTPGGSQNKPTSKEAPGDRHKTHSSKQPHEDSSRTAKHGLSSSNDKENTTSANEKILQNDREYRTVFTDDFKNNENNWLTREDKDVLLSVQKNAYYFEHKSTEGNWWTSLSIGFKPDEDFLLSTEITKSSGTLDFGYGLFLGFNKEPRYSYNILLSGNGKYRITKTINGKTAVISDWIRCENIIPGNGATNMITLHRVGNRLSIFFNNKYASTIPYESTPYGKFCFVIYNQQAILIKKIIYKVKLL